MLKRLGIFTLVALLNPVVAFAQSTICDDLSLRLRAPMRERDMVELSENDLEKVKIQRVCVKSYPWPKGVFFVDTEEGEKAISSAAMRALMLRIDALIEEYEKEGLDGLAKYDMSDLTATRFYLSTAMGLDKNLLKKYGYFLYMQVLLREGHLELMRYAEFEFKTKWIINVKASSWDYGDQNTYFSSQTIDNLLVLLSHRAIAEKGLETSDVALKAAEAFANDRVKLSYEISMLGDDAEKFLWNAGCD